MDKKVEVNRGSEYPLKLRGFAFFLSIMILFSYFPVYAYSDDDYGISPLASDDVIAAMHYETMQKLAEVKSEIVAQGNRLTNNMTSLKEKIFAYIDDASLNIKNNSLSLKNNGVSELKSYIDSSFNSFYSELLPNFTAVKEKVNAHTDEVFGNLQKSVEKGSSDIQQNADKNTQNQIDNANQNFEEQKKNDNENTSKIGGFFDKFFENISNFLKFLFMPSDDYFDTLRADLDLYLTEHLGVVYELPVTLLEETKTMYNGIKSQYPEAVTLYIKIPKITFTLNGVTYNILSSQSYNLFAFVSSMPNGFQTAYYKAITIMHVIIDISLAVACFRMIYKKIINKVGIEGGSDL